MWYRRSWVQDPSVAPFAYFGADARQALARRAAACQSRGVTYEALDHWQFVTAAYVIGVGGTLALVGWSWLAMHRAERRRDKSREP